MNEITAITPQSKDKTRCNVFLDGRFYCGLSLQTVMTHRLKVGQTISEESLSKIQLESEKATALDKALTHISAARKTEKQIRDFLSKKGYLPDVIAYVLEKMRGYDFINDADYAKQYVSFAAAKKGGRLVKMQLRAKGVADEEIDAALSGLDEQTQQVAANTLLLKYMRGKQADRQTQQKAYRYLLGKGFDYDVVKAALAAFFDVTEE